MTALVWFRHDLRTIDHPALAQAQANHKECHAVIAWTPGQWQQHTWSARRQALYLKMVGELQQELAAAGIPLHIVQADYFRELPQRLLELIEQQQIDALYFHREYALDEVRRDRAVCAWLERHQVQVTALDGQLLVPPEAVHPAGKPYYQKFTPFARAWRQHLAVAGLPKPTQMRAQGPALHPDPDVLPRAPAADLSGWPQSFAAVAAAWDTFREERLANYHTQRDVPAKPGTSRLSPYLAMGVLSPITIARRLQQEAPEFPAALSKGAAAWLNELAWREFYIHLVWHEPRLCKGEAFQRETDAYPWQQNPAALERWQQGRTGFPIVDAGMRQLLAEGWMHNRVRMIVASFLTKDLHIDWRLGEHWFMSQLVDGNLPANNGGWQWSASTGTDAAPYFRVFNPTRQSERVDPSGQYIRKYVPELSEVPDKVIHAPHDWLDKAQPGHEYPPPIVDHKAAREAFLAAFKRVKNG